MIEANACKMGEESWRSERAKAYHGIGYNRLLSALSRKHILDFEQGA